MPQEIIVPANQHGRPLAPSIDPEVDVKSALAQSDQGERFILYAWEGGSLAPEGCEKESCCSHYDYAWFHCSALLGS